MKLKTIFLSLGLFAATGAVATPVQWAGNGHWYELVSGLQVECSLQIYKNFSLQSSLKIEK